MLRHNLEENESAQRKNTKNELILREFVYEWLSPEKTYNKSKDVKFRAPLKNRIIILIGTYGTRTWYKNIKVSREIINPRNK